jgi:predicted lipoprotein with Yx(FWY)xxD motif
MKKIFYLLTLLFIVGPTAGFAMNHAVTIRENAEGGKYLADAQGKTLYWFEKDSPGMSACTGQCVEKWPLFFRESVAPPEGMSPEDFSTITRKDGAKQTTFRGYPLYYWVGDTKPGDTSGHGFNDVWFVVDPNKFPPE